MSIIAALNSLNTPWVVLAGFFGGFFVALYGVFIYDQRRRLGASLIGLGTLSAWGSLAYMIFTLAYGRFTISG